MMNRLTIRCDLGLQEVEQTAIIVSDDKEGLYDIYDLANDWKEEWAHDLLEKIILKLAEYEDLNLTPAQLQEIDKLYVEKCKEVVKLKERNKFYEDAILKIKEYNDLIATLELKSRKIKEEIGLPKSI